MPRYVVLEHDYPGLHWDLMLEAGDVLRTWRLAAPPCVDQAAPATATFDHRPVYLDYEGPISGGRGQVVRWDAGTFTWQADAPEEVKVYLTGGRLRGQIRLTHVSGQEWTAQYTAEV